MAIYHPNRPTEDIGHGTRTGFRVVSLLGVIAFILFVAWFAFGPTVSNVDTVNPPAGDTNTPTESMAAPEQQPNPPAPSPQPATP